MERCGEAASKGLSGENAREAFALPASCIERRRSSGGMAAPMIDLAARI
jgi:hypothetical protein